MAPKIAGLRNKGGLGNKFRSSYKIKVINSRVADIIISKLSPISQCHVVQEKYASSNK